MATLELLGRAMLDDLSSVVVGGLGRVADLPGYRDLPDLPLLLESVASIAIQALFIEGNDLADSATGQTARAILAEQARGGLPLESARRSAHDFAQELWAGALRAGHEIGANDALLGEVGTKLMRVLEQADAVITDVFHELEIEAALSAEARERDAFLHRLFAGSVGDDEAFRFGLSRGRLHVPFVARAFGDSPAVERALRAHVRVVGGIAGSVGGDLAGVTAVPTFDELDDCAIGLGPAADLADLPRAFQEARVCVDTAFAFDRRGVFVLADFGLRPLMVGESLVTDRLVDRLVSPLSSLGTLGTSIEETLRALLANGMRLEVTARAMHIHPNTLRYRVKRYEELVSVDLRDTETVVALWWALEASARSPRPPA